MSLLIQNGLLMTMTERGNLRSDLLIEHGVITCIADRIPTDDVPDARILDADGLVITPGLIDLTIHYADFDTDYLHAAALDGGITTYLLRSDTENEYCVYPESFEHTYRHICCIDPECLTDLQLAECLHEADKRFICRINSQQQFMRVYAAMENADIPPILTYLKDGGSYINLIAELQCPVLIRVRSGKDSPWQMAAELDALGVPVAVCSSSNGCQMKFLPVCAGLCLRDGMPRDRALRTVTSTPADILGLPDRGRIRPGMRADLTIFDGDPLMLATSHVLTIAKGKIIRNQRSNGVVIQDSP